MKTNPNYQPTPKAAVRVLTTLHLAIFAAPLLFGLIAITRRTKPPIIDLNNTFFAVILFFGVAAVVVGRILFKKRLEEAAVQESLSEKLKIYQTGFIMRSAILEGTTLLGLVGYFLEGNLLMVIVPVLLITYHLILRPTKDRIAEDLNLSYEDRLLFD